MQQMETTDERKRSPRKPQTEEELCSLKWFLFLKSLTINDLSVIKNEKGNFFTTEVKNVWSNFKLHRAVTDYYSYGNAKNGKILFAAGDTFELCGNGVKPIVANYIKGKLSNADLLDKDKQEIEAFMSPIRDALMQIDHAGVYEFPTVPQVIGANIQAELDFELGGNDDNGEHVELENPFEGDNVDMWY